MRVGIARRASVHAVLEEVGEPGRSSVLEARTATYREANDRFVQVREWSDDDAEPIGERRLMHRPLGEGEHPRLPAPGDLRRGAPPPPAPRHRPRLTASHSLSLAPAGPLGPRQPTLPSL